MKRAANLTRETVIEIKELINLYDGVLPPDHLAKMCGVSTSTLNRIKHGDKDYLLGDGRPIANTAAAPQNGDADSRLIATRLSNVCEQLQSTRNLMVDLMGSTTLDEIHADLVITNELLAQFAYSQINREDPTYTPSKATAAHFRDAVSSCRLARKKTRDNS